MKSICFSITIFVILFFSACTSTQLVRKANYDITVKEGVSDSILVFISPNTGREEGFCFTLTNKGSEAINLDWDNSYLVINNQSLKCIHAGIRFMEKSAPQPMTPIAPGSYISDCLFPINNINYDSENLKWIQDPLNPQYGDYSLAIIRSDSSRVNIQGTFVTNIIEIPVTSNLSSTETAWSFYLIASSIALLISSIVLLTL